MLNNFDNWIFDLDGTLVNSTDEVLRCFKHAFYKAEYPVDESRFTSDIIGPPLRDIIKLVAPELSDERIISKIVMNFRQIYDYDENDISTLYDGIFDLLLQLKNEGKKLFIATFKPTIPTMRLVDKFNLNMFDDVYTIDKFGEPISKSDMIADIISRYSLDKSKTVMVGDAPTDMTAAKDVGIKGIGVLWGCGSDKTELIKNADYIVEKAGELTKCPKSNCPII